MVRRQAAVAAYVDVVAELLAELRTGTSRLLKLVSAAPGDRFNGRRQRAVLGFQPRNPSAPRPGRRCRPRRCRISRRWRLVIAVRPRTPPLLYYLRIGGSGLKASGDGRLLTAGQTWENVQFAFGQRQSGAQHGAGPRKRRSRRLRRLHLAWAASKRDVIVHVVRFRRLWRGRLHLWQFALGRWTDTDQSTNAHFASP
jgi:hypothetical protein